jgi:hypothetical protein
MRHFIYLTTDHDGRALVAMDDHRAFCFVWGLSPSSIRTVLDWCLRHRPKRIFTDLDFCPRLARLVQRSLPDVPIQPLIDHRACEDLFERARLVTSLLSHVER